MLVMSMHYFQAEITGIMKDKEIAQNSWYGVFLRTHISFGLIAMLIGPFQFVESIRRKHGVLHKNMGYAYCLGVVVSSTTGLVVAQFAMGGSVSEAGFSLLSLFWFSATIAALVFIIQGNVKWHRTMMFISFALTFAAIPQRTMLLIPLFLEIDFMAIYKLSAWVPWIANMIIALFVIDRSNRVAGIPSRASASNSQ
jgi:uncharacterized membrane protein